MSAAVPGWLAVMKAAGARLNYDFRQHSGAIILPAGTPPIALSDLTAVFEHVDSGCRELIVLEEGDPDVVVASLSRELLPPTLAQSARDTDATKH